MLIDFLLFIRIQLYSYLVYNEVTHMTSHMSHELSCRLCCVRVCVWCIAAHGSPARLNFLNLNRA
jgi:hypothetical protein